MDGRNMVQFIREKHGQPPEWTLDGWSCVDLPEDFTKVHGAVYEPMKSGKRAGQPNWKKPLPGSEVHDFIRRSEVEAWALRREQETGVCMDCFGDGKRIKSIGVSGTTYRDCPRCNSTGHVQAKGGDV